MNEKKLLFIWRDLHTGGAETSLIRLANKLADDYHITLLLLYNVIQHVDIDKRIKIKYIFKEPKISGKLPSFIIALIKIIRESSSNNRIIFHDLSHLVILSYLTNLIFPFKKFYYWIHISTNEIQPTKNIIPSYLYKLTILKAYKVVCVSSYCLNSLKKYLRKNIQNTYVIYNLIDLPYIAIHSLRENDETVKISAIGRMYPEKGFDILVEAVNKLVNKFHCKQIIVKIGGDGPELEKLKFLINKYKLDKYITLVGYVHDPIKFINESDIFISPSRSEALPYNVIEALICKKPIIVTDTGAAEIIEDGKYGIVISKNNPHELAHAIFLLLNDEKLRNEFSLKSIFALDRFDTGRIIKQWNEILK